MIQAWLMIFLSMLAFAARRYRRHFDFQAFSSMLPAVDAMLYFR